MSCGTSLHTQLDHSQKTRDRYPALRARKIAVGELAAHHGKMLQTGGKSHITVWFRLGSAPEQSIRADAEHAPSERH